MSVAYALWPRARACAAVLSLGLSLAACSPPAVSLRAEAEPAGTSFTKVRDRWSRSGRILSLSQMDTPLLVSATMRSRAFQHAYSDRYLTLYRISDPSERARIEGEALAASSSVSFWVRSSTHAPSWNDLRISAGRWRLSLVDDEGHQVAPEKVEQVANRDLQQQLELLGEARDPFEKLWLVQFPAQTSDGLPMPRPTARKIILRVAGPLGQTDLTWALY